MTRGEGQGGAEGAETVADPAAGRAVYAQHCVPCHGEDGRGGHGGGAPLDRLTDAAAAMRTITEGRNNMPAFGGALNRKQIRDVTRFIVSDLVPPPG